VARPQACTSAFAGQQAQSAPSPPCTPVSTEGDPGVAPCAPAGACRPPDTPALPSSPNGAAPPPPPPRVRNAGAPQAALRGDAPSHAAPARPGRVLAPAPAAGAALACCARGTFCSSAAVMPARRARPVVSCAPAPPHLPAERGGGSHSYVWPPVITRTWDGCMRKHRCTCVSASLRQHANTPQTAAAACRPYHQQRDRHRGCAARQHSLHPLAQLLCSELQAFRLGCTGCKHAPRGSGAPHRAPPASCARPAAGARARAARACPRLPARPRPPPGPAQARPRRAPLRARCLATCSPGPAPTRSARRPGPGAAPGPCRARAAAATGAAPA